MTNRSIRSFAGLSTAAVAAALLASPASAHVRVTPNTAKPGSYATLTFKVPNESDTASTKKLEVTLPPSAPLGYVSYQPVPGWKAEVTKAKLAKPITTDDGTITEAPSKITWTATGSGIEPGQFQTFAISAGPVPETGSMQFNAAQSYSDGKVVNWNEAQKGSAEPEHPAPVLYVKDKAPDAAAGSASSAPSVAATSQSDKSDDSHDSTASWLGAGGILLGAAALVTAVWAATRRR